MISENVKRYENVIIRNDEEIGINTFGLDYLVNLEQENYKLHSIIKDVRELIDDFNIGKYDYQVPTYLIYELLDKENK